MTMAERRRRREGEKVRNTLEEGEEEGACCWRGLSFTHPSLLRRSPAESAERAERERERKDSIFHRARSALRSVSSPLPLRDHRRQKGETLPRNASSRRRRRRRKRGRRRGGRNLFIAINNRRIERATTERTGRSRRRRRH